MKRRKFLSTTIGAAGLLGVGGCVRNALSSSAEPAPALTFPVNPAVKKPTDRVKLGRSGVEVSVVGIGTGSIGWGGHSNQTRLGQESFTRLMRHSLDNGITFFDLADQYGTNPYFKRAMEGVPRDRYVVQTKTNDRSAEGARADVDRFLKEIGVDYIDSLIIHCVTEGDWTSRYRGVMDVLEEAKAQGKIRSHGVTCHSFPALKAAYASDWVQINQVRWNPKQAHMDNDVETARDLFARMRAKGQGMIGMKVVGQGDIVNGARRISPEECYRFQIESGVVDAFVVGVESVSHIDQMLRGTEVALAEVGYRAAELA